METSPGTTPTTGASRVQTSKTGRVYYAVVLASSLYGILEGLIDKRGMGLPVLAALILAGAYEFGGVVISDMADKRRQLGERAIAIRALSAAVAAGAVAFQLTVHQVMGQAVMAYVFAGVSLLGYLVWLVDSGARRRDSLRIAGKLPPTPPAYPLAEWLRHPWLTKRANRLAKEDPTLGLYGSLELARTQVRTESRDRSLASKMHDDLTEVYGRKAADILVHTYDFDAVAIELRGRAKPARIADLFDFDLTPQRIAAARAARQASGGRGWPWGGKPVAPVALPTATPPAITATADAPADATGVVEAVARAPRPRRSARPPKMRDNDLVKQRVRQMWKTGKSYDDITKATGVNRRTVERHTKDLRQGAVVDGATG